jgi:hypothetical protein
MQGVDWRYVLKIAVCAGMEVGPRYGLGKRVIDLTLCDIWVRIPRVKIMCLPDASKRADRRPQIHMVACDKKPTATPPESAYPLAIFDRQTVADVNRKQPDFVKVAFVKFG